MGAVMLLRGSDLPPFTAADARVVAELGRQLAAALRASVAVAAADAAPDPQGPGLVVLDADGELEAVTIAASAWLGELERAALPPALLSVAAQARAGPGAARARVRSASGLGSCCRARRWRGRVAGWW
jgi:hypothetical protein